MKFHFNHRCLRLVRGHFMDHEYTKMRHLKGDVFDGYINNIYIYIYQHVYYVIFTWRYQLRARPSC